MKIGVFDSGVGGISVAEAVRKAYPSHEVEFADDSANMPYGEKTPQQMVDTAMKVLEPLSRRNDVIIIACNTLTTNAISLLRKELAIPLVGIEPMIKPAAQLSKTGLIAVCATPATLHSERYAWLKKSYAKDSIVLEPDCSNWARMIQSNKLRRHHVHRQIDELCSAGVDVIVLGCTHYHWIEDMVKEAAAGRAIVLQPEQAIVQQLTRVISHIKDPDGA